MLERLTEILFIELLRHHVATAPAGASGWLAAMSDPALARGLAAIHADPGRDWSLGALAAAAGLSRSAMAERFEAVLGTSPMRYVRAWRLCLAGVALSTTRQPIAAIAHEAGYGAEAAFNRAFARANGVPPAAWRAKAQEAGGGAAAPSAA
jgi:transcriptional regulator GlxA family with amidase domain